MNRYAYVEGAPESFVDVLGFFRAAAAIRAQKLAVAQAAYDAAVAAYDAVVSEQARVHDRQVSNVHQQARLFQREVGQIQDQAAARQASAQWATQQAARVKAAAAGPLLPTPHPGVVDWTVGSYDVCTADGVTAWLGAANTAAGTTTLAASKAGTNLYLWRWYGEGSPSTVSASGSMLSSVSRPGAAQTLNTIGKSPGFQFAGTGFAGLSLVTSTYSATQSSLNAGEEPGLAAARGSAAVASTSVGILASMGAGAAVGTLIPVPVVGTVVGALVGLAAGLLTTYVVNDQLNKQIDREYYGG